MPFKKGEGGRIKGVKNRKTLRIEEMAAKFDLDPFEILMMVACGDWEGLGYDAKSRVSYTAQGIEFEEDVIKISDRTGAAKEAAKYLHSQKQSVSISGSEGAPGIRIIVEDYCAKKAT